MPTKMPITQSRIVGYVLVVSLVGLALASGGAAAHNPACHQVAGPDGPHYDDDAQTGSQNAYDKNPNLGGDENPANEIGENDDRPGNAADGCSVGDSQSQRSDN